MIDGISRCRHRDELDRMMGEATHGWDARELMGRLQAAGVAAGAVLDSKDLLFDPHLRHRQFFEVVHHHASTGIPPLPYAGRPWKLLGTPALAGNPAPIMGEHNESVLGELLCRTDEGISSLEAQGVIGYGPVDPRPVQRRPLEEQVREGRMQRYEVDFQEQVAGYFGIKHPSE